MASPRREAQKARSRQAKAARLAAQRRQRNIKVVSVIVVVAVLFTGAGTFFSATGNDDEQSTTTTTSTPDAASPAVEPVAAGRTITGPTPCPPADGSAERANSFEGPPPMCIDPARTYTATFDTTEGRVVVALDTARTPNTTNNFVVLSRYKYYDGSAIFRTDPSIDIIQGGSPNTQDNSDAGPGYTIADEGSGFTYTEGDLVMARTGAPNSASAQYFFATGPNVSNLDSQGTYVTFGKVTEGLDVLKRIIGLHQPSGQLGGAPSRPVIVNSVTITES